MDTVNSVQFSNHTGENIQSLIIIMMSFIKKNSPRLQVFQRPSSEFNGPCRYHCRIERKWIACQLFSCPYWYFKERSAADVYFCMIIGYVGSKSFLQQLYKLIKELKEVNRDVKFGQWVREGIVMIV